MSDFYREASARIFGLFPIRWREDPFQWISGERYSILRRFEGGIFRQFVGGIELEETSAGTILRVFAELTPRTLLGMLLAPLVGHKGIRDTLRYCENSLGLIRSGSRPPYPRSRTRTPVSKRQLHFLLPRLLEMPIQQDLVPLLTQHLVEGTDEEVLRMKPYALARQWQTDPQEVLRLFFYATKAGLLNLKWEMMCPNCRVPKAEYETLFAVSKQFHCDLCGVDLEADLDRYVELRFSVHPAVRQAQDAVYCIGGPMNTPHILLQQYLEPGGEREVSLPLSQEPLRFRALRYNHTAPLTCTDQQTDALEIEYTQDGWKAKNLFYQPGTIRLRLRNSASQILIAVLERLEWDKEAVTAAQVTTRQEFRELFASEILAPGQEIGIQNLSVLFTDLKGSTSLYEIIGDAPAYGRVHRHFSLLMNCIKKNQGALVKTIGDAVMAVFTRPEAALQAALDIHAEIDRLNRTYHIDPPLIIKIGIHHGPAIAINANNRLDYFGRTVNIAARIQGESRGGDIVFPEELLQYPGVQEVVQKAPKPTSFPATLKGIAGAFTLYRIHWSSIP